MYTPAPLCAAVGMFDGVHIGHRSLIANVCDAASARGYTPAVFTFDIHPLEIVAPERSPKLICTLDERVALLREAGIKQVEVLRFDNDMRRLSSEDFMAMLRQKYDVEALVVGFNHRFGHGASGSFDHYRQYGSGIGIDVIQASECEKAGVSSTAIRLMLAQGQVDHAAAMLARPFRLSGTVEHGHKLGRTIGFPTANIHVDPRIILPAPGVYATKAVLPDGSVWPAMVNIGVRPTVDNSTQPPVTVEAHIIGFSGNLYDRTISLDFISFIRPERRFASTGDLAARLAADRDATLNLISNQ